MLAVASVREIRSWWRKKYARSFKLFSARRDIGIPGLFIMAGGPATGSGIWPPGRRTTLHSSETSSSVSAFSSSWESYPCSLQTSSAAAWVNPMRCRRLRTAIAAAMVLRSCQCQFCCFVLLLQSRDRPSVLPGPDAVQSQRPEYPLPLIKAVLVSEFIVFFYPPQVTGVLVFLVFALLLPLLPERALPCMQPAPSPLSYGCAIVPRFQWDASLVRFNAVAQPLFLSMGRDKLSKLQHGITLSPQLRGKQK